MQRERKKFRGNQVLDLLIHGGLDATEFRQIAGKVADRNRSVFRIMTVGLAILTAILFLISPYSVVLRPNRSLYLLYTIVCLACNAVLRKTRNAHAVTLICYLTLALGLSYGFILVFVIRTYLDFPAVSLVVLLAMLPLIMTDVIWRMALAETSAVLLFILLSARFCEPDIFVLNCTNSIAMSIISLALFAITTTQDFRRFALEQRIRDERETESVRLHNIIDSLADIIESRDETTGNHVVRTAEGVRELISWIRRHGNQEEFRPYAQALTPEFCDLIVEAAPLHDVGKIKISDTILNKPGSLTPQEYATMQKHAAYGGEIVNAIIGKMDMPAYQQVAYHIARSHHERWDGTGYPDRLKGSAIPLEARILSIVDVYDALVTERVYKHASSENEALAIIKVERGAQFDPVLTDAFLAMKKEERGRT